MQIDIKRIIQSSITVKQEILANVTLLDKIQFAAEKMITCFENKGKVLFCGNGGSAADAQHLAAELSGRFYLDRDPLYAEALHVNSSYLTAMSNDYGFDQAYARMLKAVAGPGDILVAISTSGNSPNIINAVSEANTLGVHCIGMTGSSGGKMKEMVDTLINVPGTDTPRIQEAHILIGHAICELVERAIFGQKS